MSSPQPPDRSPAPLLLDEPEPKPPRDVISLIAEITRYVGAGGVNTVFGVAAYFLLVWLGLDQYVAQLVAHILGSAFNYYMLRVHVFRSSTSSFPRFVASYVLSYLLSLGVLILVNRFIAPVYDARLLVLLARVSGGTPRKAAFYLSGVFTIVIVAVINYFVLKRFVFRRA